MTIYQLSKRMLQLELHQKFIIMDKCLHKNNRLLIKTVVRGDIIKPNIINFYDEYVYTILFATFLLVPITSLG